MIRKHLTTQSSDLVLRSATQNDYHRLDQLIGFEFYAHRHLDYRSPLDWIGSPPFLVLEKDKHLLATLACPPDPPEVAWLRLFAVDSKMPLESTWETLWENAYRTLLENPTVCSCAAIPFQNWLELLLCKSNFSLTHHIVSLRLDNPQIGRTAPQSSIEIQPMSLSDIKSVASIDKAAFTPIWQNSRPYLEFVFRQSLIATIAKLEGQIVGYQISTQTSLGCHLARLAILPRLQGKGIGFALVQNLLEKLSKRGFGIVTVNTQQNNLSSLALYHKFGFQETGERYPVYEKQITRDLQLEGH